MIWIILAAGLGASFIAIALLFRRARQLARQLSDMRAERNSEWILHALKSVPDEQGQVAPAANGDFEPSTAGEQPVRRKKHLGLFLGGGSAAVLTGLCTAGRRTWQRHPGLVVAGAAVGAAGVATAVVLTGAPGHGHSSGARSPSSAPTVTATITAIRMPSSRPTVTTTARLTATITPASPSTPSESGSPSFGSSAPPGAGDASSEGGLPPTRSESASSLPSRPPTAAPSATPSPSTPSGAHAPCLDVAVESVLDLAICLAGGR
jgi:hypothetical protein